MRHRQWRKRFRKLMDDILAEINSQKPQGHLSESGMWNTKRKVKVKVKQAPKHPWTPMPSWRNRT